MARGPVRYLQQLFWKNTHPFWLPQDLPRYKQVISPLLQQLDASRLSLGSLDAPSEVAPVWVEGRRNTTLQLLRQYPRLLLSGPAGVGKSSLLQKLCLASAQDETCELVPVLADLQTWQSEAPTAFLQKKIPGSGLARIRASLPQLVRQNKVVLFLDHLDASEATGQVWSSFLREHPGLRWMATCGPRFFSDLAVWRAQLLPLGAVETEEILRDHGLKSSPEATYVAWRLPLLASLATRLEMLGNRVVLLRSFVQSTASTSQRDHLRQCAREALEADKLLLPATFDDASPLVGNADLAAESQIFLSPWFRDLLAAEALNLGDPEKRFPKPEQVSNPKCWRAIALAAALGDQRTCTRIVRNILTAENGEPGLLLALACVALNGQHPSNQSVVRDALVTHLERRSFGQEWAWAHHLADVASPEVIAWIKGILTQVPDIQGAQLYALVGAIGDRYAAEMMVFDGLTHDSELIDIAAARALQEMGVIGAIVLGDALRHRDPRHRQRAADVMVQIGEPAIGVLVDQLELASPEIQKAAAQALGRIGALAIEPVLHALRSESEMVRDAAVLAIRHLEDPSATPYLIRGIRDRQPVVRRESAAALARLAGLAAAPHLRQACNDPEAAVRLATVQALDPPLARALSDVLARHLRDPEPTVREAARKQLERLGAQAIPPLLEADLAINWDGQNAVTGLVHDIGREAIAPLTDALSDRRWRVRLSAVKGLQWLPYIETVSVLTSAIQDREARVREAAALALGRLGFRDGLPPLLSALKDRQRDVRESAARALGQIGSAEAVGPLIDALDERDDTIQTVMIDALRQIGRPAVPELMEAVGQTKDNSWRVRQASIKALKRIGEPRAAPALGNALSDPDWRVQQAAIEALGTLGVEGAVKELAEMLGEGRESLRWAAVEALVKIGTPSIPALLRAIRSQRWSTRWAAATALGQLGEPAIPALMAALASSEEEVRWAAESALAQIGDPAIPPLIAALYNPDAQLRRAATEALSQINLPAAREALEEYWMTSWAGRH